MEGGVKQLLQRECAGLKAIQQKKLCLWANPTNCGSQLGAFPRRERVAEDHDMVEGGADEIVGVTRHRRSYPVTSCLQNLGTVREQVGVVTY